MGKSRLKIVYRKTAELRPHPKNPRHHSETKLAALAAYVKRVGWIGSPIVIDSADQILKGHALWTVAGRLELAEVPTITVAGLSEADSIGHLIADNQLALISTWDQGKLRDGLVALKDAGVDAGDLGFDVASIDDLLPVDASAELEEVDFSAVRDRFWISVRGPLAAQAMALQKLRTLMAELPGVSVEQGTVEGV